MYMKPEIKDTSNIAFDKALASWIQVSTWEVIDRWLMYVPMTAPCSFTYPI